MGLIGESGAGKTTTGLAALNYTRPGCVITSGRIMFDGTDLRTLSPHAIRHIRGRRIGYIAQSAAASFNPVWRLKKQVSEPPVPTPADGLGPKPGNVRRKCSKS